MPAVTYHCPRCETVVSIQRDAYLADRSVTSYPLEGRSYTAPDAFVPGQTDDAGGIRFVCGESDDVEWKDVGCGEPFFLNFVRRGDGVGSRGRRESEYVELNLGPSTPRGPRGPSCPGGPSGPSGPGGR